MILFAHRSGLAVSLSVCAFAAAGSVRRSGVGGQRARSLFSSRGKNIFFPLISSIFRNPSYLVESINKREEIAVYEN